VRLGAIIWGDLIVLLEGFSTIYNLWGLVGNLVKIFGNFCFFKNFMYIFRARSLLNLSFEVRLMAFFKLTFNALYDGIKVETI